MNEKKRIDVGDTVDVYLGDYTEREDRVKVLYTPAATGDSWVVQRRDGTIVHVQMFQKMVLRSEDK